MKFSRHRAGHAFTALLTLGAITTGIFLGCRSDFGGGNGGGGGGGGGSSDDFLSTGRTSSFFTAVQVDPQSEDTAGPQFVTSADIDDDGLMDLVSAWNQSQPIQIHFQRNSNGNRSFETVTLAGNTPVVRVAGLDVGDFDGDGAIDIAVLVKEAGLNNAGITCFGGIPGEGYHGLIIVYFAPADSSQVEQALAWQETPVESSRVLGTKIDQVAGSPEEEGYTSLAVGDLDNDGDLDLAAALNDACTAIDPKVLTFTNAGVGAVRDGTWAAVALPDPFDKSPRLADDLGIFPPARIKQIALGDVDNDGDLDVFATYPEAVSMNIRWYRNPSIDIPDDYHFTSSDWRVGTVGQIAPNVEPFPGPFEDLGAADAITVGDVDGDDLIDVVVRSTGGKVIQWLKGPGFEATTDPVRAIPWRVYTLAEFSERTPEGISVGDVDMDGQLDVIAAAGGGFAFFDGSGSVFNQWSERLIVDDVPADGEGVTFVNSIHVVDLDNDGYNDIVATFDRSGGSGLSNDALVWFRSTLP